MSGAYDSTIVGTWMWIQKLLSSTGRSRAIDGVMRSALSWAARVARNARSEAGEEEPARPEDELAHEPGDHGAARDEEQGLVEVSDQRRLGERGPLDEPEDVVGEPDEPGSAATNPNQGFFQTSRRSRG